MKGSSLAPRTLRGRIALAAAATSVAAIVGTAVVVDDAVRRQAYRVLEESTRAEADALASLVRIEKARVTETPENDDPADEQPTPDSDCDVRVGPPWKGA